MSAAPIPAQNTAMEDRPDMENTPGQASAAPLLVDGKGLAAMLSIGLSLVYQMDRSGHLGPMGLRLGRRRLWRRDEVAAWVRAGCPRREMWLKMAQEQGFGHQGGRRF